jgi:hypothetical protein
VTAEGTTTEPERLGGRGLPLGFVVAIFVVAAAVGAIILYLGLHGQLGGPIP